MSKRALSLVMALAFALSTVSVGWAASVKCTVEKIDGATVTLDCGSKASKLAVGSAVKVKAQKKKAIEGC